MSNFNISFEFVDYLGDNTIARAEQRDHRLHVFVNKFLYQQLSNKEKFSALTHECSHAIAQFAI